MRVCAICKYETTMDDVVVRLSGGRCICLGCFDRQTADPHRMPKSLRRELTAVLAEMETA
jgi:hypothetical protein